MTHLVLQLLDLELKPGNPGLQFGHFNPLIYAALIFAGILAIGIAPPLLLDRLRKPEWKATGGGPAPQS